MRFVGLYRTEPIDGQGDEDPAAGPQLADTYCFATTRTQAPTPRPPGSRRSAIRFVSSECDG
jgi:hypothetical protein